MAFGWILSDLHPCEFCSNFRFIKQRIFPWRAWNRKFAKNRKIIKIWKFQIALVYCEDKCSSWWKYGGKSIFGPKSSGRFLETTALKCFNPYSSFLPEYVDDLRNILLSLPRKDMDQILNDMSTAVPASMTSQFTERLGKADAIKRQGERKRKVHYLYPASKWRWFRKSMQKEI